MRGNRICNPNRAERAENPIETIQGDYFIVYNQMPKTPNFQRIDHPGVQGNGLDAYLNRILLCPLCRKTLVEPVTDTCGHTFCSDCIVRARQFGNFCPLSGLEYETKKDFRLNLALNSLLNNEIPCESEFLGCNWHGTRKEMGQHMKSDCLFSYFECPNPNCSKVFTKENLQAHLAECPYNAIACQKCGWNGAFYQKIQHDASCEEKEISCKLNCGQKMKRKDMKHHIEVCTTNVYKTLFDQEIGTLPKKQQNKVQNQLEKNLVVPKVDHFKSVSNNSRNKRKGDFDKLIEDFDQTCKKVLQNNTIPDGFFTIPSKPQDPFDFVKEKEEKSTFASNADVVKKQPVPEKNIMNLLEDDPEDKSFMSFLKGNNNERDIMSLLEDDNENDLISAIAGKNCRWS